MAHIGDSRSPKWGPGVLPLQSFGRDIKGGIAGRPSVLGVRMTKDAASSPYKKPSFKTDTVGDLSRFMCWQPRRPAGRPLPEWAEVIEVITVGDGTTMPSGGFPDPTTEIGPKTPGGRGGEVVTPSGDEPVPDPYYNPFPPGTPLPPGQGDYPPQTPGGAKSAQKTGAQTGDSQYQQLPSGQVFVPGGPDASLLPQGFVGYYSPSAGGWVGSFTGGSSSGVIENNGGQPKSFFAKAAAKPQKKGPDTVGIPTILVSGKPRSAAPSGGQPVTADGGVLLEDAFGGGDIDYTRSAVPGSVIDYYGAQRGVAPYLPGWKPSGRAGAPPVSQPKAGGGDNSSSSPIGYIGGNTVDGSDLSIDPDMSMSGVLLDTDVGSPRPYWPAFPVGTYGISLRLGNADRDVRDFLPTDPRLCAVHMSPNMTDCSSLVYDVRGNGTWDEYRGATLNTAFRVVREARGQLSMGGLGPGQTGAPGGAFNSLALNIGLTGTGEALGGFVADGVFGRTTRLGRWSVRDGGFLDVGAGRDKHHIGSDFDGSPINPCHISTMAFFTDGGGTNDGPLDFENFQPARFPVDYGPYVAQVHYYFDSSKQYVWPRDKPSITAAGVWRQWTSFIISQTATTPGGGPGGGPPTGGGRPGGGVPGGPKPGGVPGPVPGDPLGPVPPGPRDPGGPITPSGRQKGAPKFQKKNKNKIVSPGQSGDLSSYREHGVTVAEIAGPGWLARPQKYKVGVVDTRYAAGWLDAQAVEFAESTTPVTQRISAWGVQGGNTAPGTEVSKDNILGNPVVGADPWVYTQRPGASREMGGTGEGGQVILPPEVDLSDIDSDFDLGGNCPLSPTWFGTGPGASFFAGTPNISKGGVRDGYSWGVDSADLLFTKHAADGTETSYMRLDGSQSLNVVMASPADGSVGEIRPRQLAAADMPLTLTAPPSSVVNGPAFNLAWAELAGVRMKGYAFPSLPTPTGLGGLAFNTTSGKLAVYR